MPICTRVFAGETVTLEDAHHPLDRTAADGGRARDDAWLPISSSPTPTRWPLAR